MDRRTREAVPAAEYDDVGEGPAVVLIHGVGLARAMWSNQIAALRENHRVVAIDMLGHGESRIPPDGATLDDYADHVVEILDALGIGTAVLIGFSMGALVARAFALRYPRRLEGLVFLNSVFARTPEATAAILARVAEVRAHGPAANIDAAIERWFSPDFRSGNVSYLADLRRAVSANDRFGYEISYRLFATEDGFGAERLSTIAVPVLVATGELDVGSTPAMAAALADRIPGARLAIVPDARHMMPVERGEQVNALLRDFLGSLPARASAQGASR